MGIVKIYSTELKCKFKSTINNVWHNGRIVGEYNYMVNVNGSRFASRTVREYIIKSDNNLLSDGYATYYLRRKKNHKTSYVQVTAVGSSVNQHNVIDELIDEMKWETENFITT